MQVVNYKKMKSESGRRSDCPINFGLETFGDRWSLLIVRDLMFQGKRYYGDFLEGEEKISTNILANRLQVLENSGIITRAADPANRRKIIYTLAPKGIDLLPMLVELIVWSHKYDPESAASKVFVKQARHDRNDLIARLNQQLVEAFSRTETTP